ncbi:MAG: DUF87 domain-containing protein [Clostridiaceae bacterium]
MKTFHTKSGTYALCALHITCVPYEKEKNETPNIAKAICEDAYYLGNGDGRLSIELLRVAGTTAGNPICHLLVLRCFNETQSGCEQVAAAFCESIKKRLTVSGYRFGEMSFEVFAGLFRALNRTAVWALTKQEIRECECMSPRTYVSLPVLCGSLDFSGVYQALDGSGCAVSIHATASALKPAEYQAVQQLYADCSRAVEGTLAAGQAPRDSLASLARERWQYCVHKAHGPMFFANFVVYGPPEAAAIVVSRLRGSFIEMHTDAPASLRAIDISKADISRVYDQPWQLERAVAERCLLQGYSLSKTAETSGLIRRFSSEEVGAVLALPKAGRAYCGVGSNAFSLLKPEELLDKELTAAGAGTVQIGQSDGGRTIALPMKDFLLHMSVYGKTGVGKTKLLQSIVEQLAKNGVSVLVLEPIKREYRTLVRSANARVFTVDSSTAPFVLNPFLVPKGVTLAQYRPHLLNAFSAAFSMPDPLPSLFGTAITEAYALNGWKSSSKSADSDVTVFGLWEFVQVFQKVVQNSAYSPEIKGNMTSGGTFRLLSLIDRCRNTFETIHSTDVLDLISGQVVLELGRLEGEQKCLVAALTLISILSYLRTVRESGTPLTNVILMDEAHVLLDPTASRTEEGSAAGETMENLIVNLIAEVRALGVGVIFADQSPTRVGGNLLNNTDTKIIFRLTGDEAQAIAHGIGLDEEETRMLPLLEMRQALLVNHTLRTPLGITTLPRAETKPVTDEELTYRQQAYLQSRAELYRPFRECELFGLCEQDCKFSVRDCAAARSIRMFSERAKHIRTADELRQHLLWIPASLIKQGNNPKDPDFPRLCGCVALHVYRQASMKLGERIQDKALRGILADYMQQAGRSGIA